MRNVWQQTAAEDHPLLFCAHERARQVAPSRANAQHFLLHCAGLRHCSLAGTRMCCNS